MLGLRLLGLYLFPIDVVLNIDACALTEHGFNNSIENTLRVHQAENSKTYGYSWGNEGKNVNRVLKTLKVR